MQELKWINTMNWDERIETRELNWMNEMNELTWANWHEWIEWLETNELKQMNWNEAIDLNELNWMNEMTDLTWMNWHVKLKKPSVFYFLCDQLLDDDVVDIWNRALATVSCTFCRPLSGSRRAPAKTEITKKNTGFAPESVFSREFTRSRSLPLPNYLMMVWLTWGCGWHDGATAGCENRS